MRWLALAVLAAIALRFPALGEQSYWTDEASTALELNGSLGHLLASVRDFEGMPPLYFVLAWLWTRAFGLGEFGLRSLSAVFGTLTVPVAWALARELRPAAAPWAAGLVACSPFLVWYSQEARPYALLVLLTALMTLFWVQDRPGGWGAAAGAALLTHYFAVFLVVPQAIAMIRRGHARALLAPAITAAALAPLIVSQTDARVDWITDSSLGARIADVAKHFAAGEFGTPVDVLGVLAVALLAIGAVRAGASSRPVLAAIAVAAALPVVLALLGADYVLDRYLIATLVPLLAVAAAGLPRPAAAVLIALFAGFTINVVADPGLQREDWRGLEKRLPATGFVVAAPEAERPLEWYRFGHRRPDPDPMPVSDIAVVGRRRPGEPVPQPPTTPAGFPLVERRVTGTTVLYAYHHDPAVVVEPIGLYRARLRPAVAPIVLALDRP